MTIEKLKYGTINQSNRKEKYAISTENRRLMWEYIIDPLVLELDKNYSRAEEYHKIRNKVSIEKNIQVQKCLGGLVSLLLKGILTQDKKYYSIHYKLIPYMRKNANLDYEIVLREVRSKKVAILIIQLQLYTLYYFCFYSLFIVSLLGAISTLRKQRLPFSCILFYQGIR
jgi:hypothetical protein